MLACCPTTCAKAFAQHTFLRLLPALHHALVAHPAALRRRVRVGASRGGVSPLDVADAGGLEVIELRADEVHAPKAGGGEEESSGTGHGFCFLSGPSGCGRSTSGLLREAAKSEE